MKIDTKKDKFTSEEMIYMLKNQEKLDRIEEFLVNLYEEFEESVNCLVSPDQTDKGFYRLGAHVSDLFHLIENEFPESEKEIDEDQEKCCKDLPY